MVSSQFLPANLDGSVVTVAGLLHRIVNKRKSGRMREDGFERL